MYRDLLITKEKMKQICTGKGYRQKDHETSTGGDTYKDSVADDLEAFFEDTRLGKRPLSIAWTYFLPELNLQEMELVENKDQVFFRTFKWLNNADVNETEMKLSSSTSKFVSAYCRRKTIVIERQESGLLGSLWRRIKSVESISDQSLLGQSERSLRNSQSIGEMLNQFVDSFPSNSSSLIGARQSLLGHSERSLRNAQSTKKTPFKKLLKRKWFRLLFSMILVLMIGGTVAGLFIYLVKTTTPTTNPSTTKTLGVNDTTTTTPPLMLASPASTKTTKIRVGDSRVNLGTLRPSQYKRFHEMTQNVCEGYILHVVHKHLGTSRITGPN